MIKGKRAAAIVLGLSILSNSFLLTAEASSVTESSITKGIIDGEGNEIGENEVKPGESYTYIVTQVIADDSDIKKMTFYDNLEDALKVTGTRVYIEETVDAVPYSESDDEDDDNIIPLDDVDVNVQDNESIVSWEINDANDLKGKTVVTEIDVRLPEGTDIKDAMITNVAKGTINDEEFQSNEVQTVLSKSGGGSLFGESKLMNTLIIVGVVFLVIAAGWRLSRIRKR